MIEILNAADGELIHDHIKETQESGQIIMRLPPEEIRNPNNVRLAMTDGILWEWEQSDEQLAEEAAKIAEMKAIEAKKEENSPEATAEYLLDLDFRLTCLEFGI